MKALNVIASFLNESDAQACYNYARQRYTSVTINLSAASYQRFPWSISLDPYGRENQLAIAFILGYAYAMPRYVSHVPEVMCKGDQRDRYKNVGAP